MSELAIYTSTGELYGEGQREILPSHRIKEFYAANLQLSVDFSGQPTIVGYFQARESRHSRYESYYAVYRDNRATEIFNRFIDEVTSRVENEYELEMNPSGEDVPVFNNLLGSSPPMPGSDFDHKLVRDILNDGRSVRLGVNDYNTALGVFKEYVRDKTATSAAVAQNGTSDNLSQFDLVIERGAHSGLKPLGDTTGAFDRARQSREDQFVSQKVKQIRSDVRDLRRQTNMSDDEIRERLQRQVPLVATQPTESDDGVFGSLGIGVPSLGGPGKIVSIGMGIMAVIMIVVALASLGVVPAGPLDSLPGIGGGVSGEQVATITANGSNQTLGTVYKTGSQSFTIIINRSIINDEIDGKIDHINVSVAGKEVGYLGDQDRERYDIPIEDSSDTRYRAEIIVYRKNKEPQVYGESFDTSSVSNSTETPTASPPTPTTAATATPTPTATQTPTPPEQTSKTVAVVTNESGAEVATVRVTRSREINVLVDSTALNDSTPTVELKFDNQTVSADSMTETANNQTKYDFTSVQKLRNNYRIVIDTGNGTFDQSFIIQEEDIPGTTTPTATPTATDTTTSNSSSGRMPQMQRPQITDR